jgi:4-hydroxybenzoate polyprenyltransferase
VTGGWRIWASVARPHILSIIFASTITYGWIFRGEHTWDLALIGFIAVWDWFIVNWTNKATDLEEDLANGIAGAAEVAAHKRVVEGLGWAMMIGGLLAGLWVHPELLPLRLSFTAVGIVYNYNVLGFKRLKERYFFKNFGSSILFTHSVFLYPLFGQGLEGSYPVPALLLSILFFLPLELTYEILYDLRDYEGDKQLGVPTFPVAHGPDRAKTIIYGLLAFSAIWPVLGAASGLMRLREWVVVAAVLQQLVLMRVYAWRDRRPSARECVTITYWGTGQLVSYNLWIAVGLPLGP